MKDAKEALNDGLYALRLSQEAVELSLKASLRLVAIEYPKKHDVSNVLIEVKERYPEWFKSENRGSR
ncbi:MAG: HEPN domain-containing protein [Candidatus Nezhaarchaeales archaeon]